MQNDPSKTYRRLRANMGSWVGIEKAKRVKTALYGRGVVTTSGKKLNIKQKMRVFGSKVYN